MSLPPAFFSKHATERTTERFKVAPEKLAGLMNEGLGKRIGLSKASNLIHRLLWSPADNDLLVAIQEVVSGTVLTVLPLEMYRRDYAENLTEKRIRYVINQMVQAGHAPVELWQPGDCPSCVTVHAHVAEAPKPISLGRWPGTVTSANLGLLGERLEFWTWVAQRLAEKHLDIARLMRVEARFSGGQNWEVPFRLPCEP